ncbi:Putative conserved hypothetical protein [Candidatus Fokinia solitaria]|uniref:Epoxyqueuosine reductase QueH n=1 Tax=Candidatus Fokinia solitaria TaxID=1802984 RepID=A0A2U8BSW6_9RICK|nr:epoxyqueuosine reductase QueH [Candidatus Fokinia solitaria]AWD33456.1 Putative conserved hypothetical protein [Candidatus Fokinia solitaria]
MHEVESMLQAGTDIVLHSCCAPCSGEVIRKMKDAGLNITIFFYNPNIHPKAEYEIRKSENIRYAEKLGIDFVDGDYNVQDWFANAKGLEKEPERGIRCTMCFDMRFEITAKFAKQRGVNIFTSSLGISRWKDMSQINNCGIAAAKKHNVQYWTYNWRLDGGSERMYKIAKSEGFYKQEYCGCIFSLRDSNEWRVKKGRKPITICKEFYEE